MPAELRLTELHWTQLSDHLLGDDHEHAALLVCGVIRAEGQAVLTTRQVHLLTHDDMLDSGPLHLSIAPTSLARIAKHARAQGLTIVLCHSHPWPGAVGPSRLDLETEADLCGRVLSSRLRHPVGALVLGQDGFSARLWAGAEASPIESLRVIGQMSGTWPPSEPGQTSEDVDRQVRAWGALGQCQLERAKVAIVGLGGTGSHIAIQLAHLGVRHFVLIDFDTVEASNLSRVVGSVPTDVGRTKVSVFKDAIGAIRPDVSIDTHVASVLDLDPHLLVDADVIVCSTDGHGSRALLTELAQQYLIPVVDLGVEVVPTVHGVHPGGQVRVLRPGSGCLHCAGSLDPGLVREEFLSDADRVIEAGRGYLRGIAAPAPAVVALNGVVASLAVLEICQLFAGFLGPGSNRLLYRGHCRSLTTAAIEPAPSCYVCGDSGLLGLGDARQLPARHFSRAQAAGG
jgi:molybdopterin/thiamine biosynthesis adenylyltransferase